MIQFSFLIKACLTAPWSLKLLLQLDLTFTVWNDSVQFLFKTIQCLSHLNNVLILCGMIQYVLRMIYDSIQFPNAWFKWCSMVPTWIDFHGLIWFSSLRNYSVQNELSYLIIVSDQYDSLGHNSVHTRFYSSLIQYDSEPNEFTNVTSSDWLLLRKELVY